MRHASWCRPCLVLLPLLFGLTTIHAAPLGTAFTHKGEYKPGGTAVTGIYDFQIVLFDVATLGAPIVSPVIHENVPVTQGNFTVEINYGAPPFAAATQYWLETRVRAGTSTGAFTVLPVRQKLNAVPYALNVRTLPPGIVTGTSIAPNAVGPAAILDNSITATDIGTNAVGLTEINPAHVQTRVNGICAPGLSIRAIAQNGTVTCDAGGSTAWRVLGNAGTNPLSHFLGTTDNQPLNIRVNNQRVFRLEPNAISPNLIGGNAANFVTAGVRGATISGGGLPGDTDPNYSDGGPNRVTDIYGTIAGGYNNQAGNNAGSVTDDHAFATVGGGRDNIASGDVSTVAGGQYNRASDNGSTVAGGSSNTASNSLSTVAGGDRNTASGTYSTVAGGHNSAASGYASFVAGGQNNTASGNSTTVAGGILNTASGNTSTVAGGYANIANGDFSFVAGHRAKNTDPTHDGVFMFADSQDADFFSAGANTFNVRAQGGLHLNPQTNLFFGTQRRQMLNLWDSRYGIGIQDFTLYFRTDTHFAWYRGGIHNDGGFNAGGGTQLMRLENNGNLYTAGAINPPSDRNVKTDFTAVDTAALLAKVAALPIQGWRYKNDHAVRHIGPVAQDFHAAFQVGTDDKHIATVDADGVALAAIQGLNRKLEKENAELKARLTALEAQAAKQVRTQARLEVLEARFERLFQARAE